MAVWVSGKNCVIFPLCIVAGADSAKVRPIVDDGPYWSSAEY